MLGPGPGFGQVLVSVLEFDLEVLEEAEGLVDMGHKINRLLIYFITIRT